VQRFLPSLCGSTIDPDSKYKPYEKDHTPPIRLVSRSKGDSTSRKKKSTLERDLLNTITKTVDTRVDTVKEEDEIQLVMLRDKGLGQEVRSVGGTEEQDGMYIGYKKMHQSTLPNNW
jgi:hypothetical protein